MSPSPSATVSSPNPSSSLSNAVTSSRGVQVSSTTPTLAQPLSSTVIVSSKSPFTSTPGSENVHSTVSQSPSITATGMCGLSSFLPVPETVTALIPHLPFPHTPSLRKGPISVTRKPLGRFDFRWENSDFFPSSLFDRVKTMVF